MNGGVPDTLYIPLAARIYSTERFPDYFRDDEALKLKGIIPPGVTEGSSEYTYLASVARYYNTDSMERDFVRRNGKSSIVHLGTGLETAYLRLSDLDAHFYDMDLPEVIELRKNLLPPSEKETLIAGDLFNMGWAGKIDGSLPVMILVLGVFQYFREEQVVGAVRKMKELFPGAELVFDATTSGGLRYAAKYVKKTGNQSAAMFFAVDDSHAFCEKTGTEHLECRPFFADARRLLKRRAGLYTRMAMKVVDRDYRAKLIRLRLRCRHPVRACRPGDGRNRMPRTGPSIQERGHHLIKTRRTP